MKINSISITSPTTLCLDACLSSSVCLIRGRYSELALDLIREVIGDFGAAEDPDRIDDGRFVIHADTEADGKSYNVCYIRNADNMGDNRLAVNFKPYSHDFSVDDTQEYQLLCSRLNANNSNVFDKAKLASDSFLSESDCVFASFNKFIKELPLSDTRPLFIYGLPDRIDEGKELSQILEKLSSLDRQVFLSVCPSHPEERTKSPLVQTVTCDCPQENAPDSKPEDNPEESFYRQIVCPVCESKTYDNHWICPCCGWEYDGYPENHYSAANGATLAEYRESFLKSKKTDVRY